METRPGGLARYAGAFAGFIVAALAFNWPLPLHLSTRLTGAVSGDTGVYVWNLWVFRHEIVGHGHLPLFTCRILSLAPPLDLSLHNYTLFADLVAFPLIPWLGVTATFNIVYLALMALTAFAMFRLAETVTGAFAESWLAGLLFGFSPVLLARSTAHFSLVAAAPLPVFLLILLRLEQRTRARDAALAGATIAWATTCDAYYGVYCVLIAGCYFAARSLGIVRRSVSITAARAIHVTMVAVGGVIASIAVTGGGRLEIGPLRVGLQTLYTPVLILTILTASRLGLAMRLRWVMRPGRQAVHLAGIAVATCAVLLSPLLYALAYRLAGGGSLHERIFWRSSPPGVDLLAYLLPNPMHAAFGVPGRTWLTTRPGALAENVASMTFVALIVIGTALWKCGFRPARPWVILTLGFTALSLGPFLHVGGVNTYLPGPWALLRYAPLVGLARTPARFAIVSMLGLSLLFALALAELLRRYPGRRRLVLLAVAMALVFELSPVPRELYSARVPDIYRTIAEDPRDVSVLNLPFGFRDGVSSVGDFSAATQFYQTLHEKRLIGGYISRMPRPLIARERTEPLVPSLLVLSEKKPITWTRPEPLSVRAAQFVSRARLGYVVMTPGATPALRDFAIDALALVKIGESDGLELFRSTLAVTEK